MFIYSALLAGCNGGGVRTRPRSTFAPRFAPILCRFRVFIAPTLARLLFGISIPTHHAVTLAALARVVVSNVSAPLFAFVPIFGWWTTCAAFAFFTSLLLASVTRFHSVQPRGGCLSWAAFGLGFGCALTCAALPPPLAAYRLLSLVSIVSNGGGYVSERRRKINIYFIRKKYWRG